jgi:hypothetical protein
MSDQIVQSEVLPTIRVLHYFESYSEGQYVEHCLDLDLVATGPDNSTALERLDALVKAQIEYALGSGNHGLLGTKAPQSYWNEFSAGTKLPSRHIQIRIPALVPMNTPWSDVSILPAKAMAVSA